MFSENFDIEEFAKDLSRQAQDAFPPEIPEDVKSFITQVIYEFIKIAYDTLGKEERVYDIEESVLVCQLVGEWMYHRGIDNYKNEVPHDYWKPILQQVAFAIWETAKEGIIRGDAREIVIDKTQKASDNVYFACMEQLVRENKLTKSLDEIKKQSNLNDYVEENYISVNGTYVTSGTYQGKGNIFKTIHNKITEIVSYPFVNFKVKKQIKELEQVKKDMQKLVDPNVCYEKMAKNCDVLRFEISENLVSLADPESEGRLLPYIARLRSKILSEELGYVIPNIRTLSSSDLPDNHYEIFVQDRPIFRGIVYPDRVMFWADEWDRLGIELPDNAITNITPNEKQYWILKTDIPKDIKIEWLTPEMVMVENLEKIAIKYVDYILSVSEVVKYNEIVEKKNKPLLDVVLNNIDIADIRVILVELIKDEYSISAILLIYEKIAQYSAQTKDPKEIADKIKKDLDELK